MRHMICAIAVLAIMTSLNAYLQYPGSDALVYRDNSLQPTNNNLTNFLYTQNYLPSDLPGNTLRDEYNTFTSDVPSDQPSYNSCAKQCSTHYEAVCGLDYQNYFNMCHALCANTKVRNFGRCNISGFNFGDCGRCANTPTAAVCGSDGISYPNACYATCSGRTVASTSCCCGSSTCCFGEISDFLLRTK